MGRKRKRRAWKIGEKRIEDGERDRSREKEKEKERGVRTNTKEKKKTNKKRHGREAMADKETQRNAKRL